MKIGHFYFLINFIPHFYLSSADKLAEEGAQETSTVTLETITKISKNKGSGAVLPVFRSDATKVVPKGMGLKKAYIGKQNTFNLNTFDAGKYFSTLFQ